jgi:hypoxanthine phosphoribosyltransferase
MSGIPEDALRETWESVYEKSLELAARIEKHCRETGEQFDAIVVVPRGSYYPVNIVARELGFESVDLLHACVSSYVPVSTERKVDFTLGQMPTDDEVKGKNLLIIEEVCDTGHTMKFLNDRFMNQGATLVRTGALHYKPGKSETGFKPDWYGTETDKWIVYPWEIHDSNGKSSMARRSA